VKIMNVQIVALLIQEGSKLLSQFIQSRPMTVELSSPETPEEPIYVSMPQVLEGPEPAAETGQNSATAIATGCVPCAIGHLGTCSGLLNEAMRFARKDGVDSPEVIERMNICLDELNSMERVDLRPELIVQLPTWEKDIANSALEQSRAARHGIESLANTADIGDLESLAANVQGARQEVGQRWFKSKMANMSLSEKAELKQHAQQHIDKMISEA
jgi:hypothetical protein